MNTLFDYYSVHVATPDDREIANFRLTKMAVPFSIQTTNPTIKDIRDIVANHTSVQFMCVVVILENPIAVLNHVNKLDFSGVDIGRMGKNVIGLGRNIITAIVECDLLPQTDIFTAVKILLKQNKYIVRTVTSRSSSDVLSKNDFISFRRFLSRVSVRQLFWHLYRRSHLHPRHTVINAMSRIPLFKHFKIEINRVLKLATNNEKQVNLIDLFTLVEEICVSSHFKFPFVPQKKFVIITTVEPNDYEINCISCIVQDYPSYLWRVICVNAYPTIDVRHIIDENSMQYQFSLFPNSHDQCNSIYAAVHTTYDDEIIVFLKGTDWFSSHEVLTQLHKIYVGSNSLVVCGSQCNYDKNKPKEMSSHIYELDSDGIMITGYAKLFKQIKLIDWLDKKAHFVEHDDLCILDKVSRMASSQLTISNTIMCVSNSNVKISSKSLTQYANSVEINWDRKLSVNDISVVSISDWNRETLHAIQAEHIVYDPNRRLDTVLVKRLMCIANRTGADMVLPIEIDVSDYYTIELGEHSEYVAYWINTMAYSGRSSHINNIDIVGNPGVYRTPFLREYNDDINRNTPILVCSINRM